MAQACARVSVGGTSADPGAAGGPPPGVACRPAGAGAAACIARCFARDLKELRSFRGASPPSTPAPAMRLLLMDEPFHPLAGLPALACLRRVGVWPRHVGAPTFGGRVGTQLA